MQKSPVNKMLLRFVILVLLGFCSVVIKINHNNLGAKPTATNATHDFTDLNRINKAFDNKESNVQVRQTGKILKILRDDDHSPKHQRFIVQLDSGLKLLVAHNIELAPRVQDIAEGSGITFFGEYEWNDKGGVVHWTHHDPRGLHPNGWLVYKDHKYD